MCGEIYRFLIHGCGHHFGLSPDTLLVLQSVLTINSVSFSLCRILYVRLVEEVLNPEQDLFNGNCWAPVLLLVQERQTDSSRGVDIRMEQWRLKLAFRWGRWVVVLEYHPQFVKPSFPRCRFLPRNGTLPIHQVECSIFLLYWPCHKAERMILPPALPFLRQSSQRNPTHLLSTFSSKNVLNKIDRTAHNQLSSVDVQEKSLQGSRFDTVS